jgi:hypothetical protein
MVWAKEGVEKKFQSFNVKLKNIIANSILSVIDEDLANKDMKDMLISTSFLEVL